MAAAVGRIRIPLRKRLGLIFGGVSQRFDRETSVPIVAQWSVPAAYALPDTFKCNKYPGLLQCQLTCAANGTFTLATYWRSEAHLNNQLTQVSTDAGLSTQPTLSQFVDIRRRSLPFTPTSPLDGIIKLSALIGALTVCYQGYGVLYASPHVTALPNPPQQQLNVLEGDDTSVEFDFTNLDAVGSVEVALSKATVRQPTAIASLADAFFTIAPGQSHSAKVFVHGKLAGTDRLTVIGRARAGKFRRSEPIELSIPLTVWRDFDIGQFTVVPPACNDTRCRAKAELRIGRTLPVSLECWARIIGYPDVDIEVVTTSADGGKPGINGVGKDYVSEITWQERASAAFQTRWVELLMMAKKPQIQWPTIVGDMKAQCHVAQGTTTP